jgi:PD-(D/E)XK nuclease superfamily
MIELRTSERTLFQRCPQRWWWAVIEGLAPHREATALWFGTLIHECLAQWYGKGGKRGMHPARYFEKIIDQHRIIINDDEWVAAKELGIEMLENYVDEYGEDDEKDYIVTEQTGSILLPDLAGNKRQIKYWYTFDGVWRSRKNGQIWLDEHKTAASIGITHLTLDNQAGSYWAVAEGLLHRRGLIGPDEHVEGIMYNFLRKARKDKRPQNADGEYTNKPLKAHYQKALEAAGVPPMHWKNASLKELEALAKSERLKVVGDVSALQPAPLFHREPIYRTPEERSSQLLRIRQDAWHMDQARRTAETGYPITKNVQSAGATACPQCPFFRMCELHEQGDMQSVEEFKAAMYTTRDPYEAYRKSA